MEWRERSYCGEITPADAGKTLLLMGWVDAIRDHGSLLFIHLRDISGIAQVVFDPTVSRESYERATRLREEYVVEVKGTVALRDKGTENPNLKTGGIEIFATELLALSRSKTLPFQISEKAMVFGEEIKENPKNVDEELRLQYRYLDLRRPSMQELLIKRYQIIKSARECLDRLSFIEIETPFLTKSTPEGARDYLVPSRVHRGRFFALPQSPQLFKQILMMSGFDRYFQIVRCFRDEDLRPNRQPEFTQLDLEASFIDEEFIYEVIEELSVRMFAAGGIDLPRPFQRMTYREAIECYGTDRPDLRFGMDFKDVTNILQETGYTVFRKVIDNGGQVKGFCVRGQAAALSKNVLQNEYSLKIAPSFGAKGMTWMKVVGGKPESNIARFFSESEQYELMRRFGAKEGDVIMMIADKSQELLNKVLCSLRLNVADKLGLIPNDCYQPVWIADFPLFELKDGKLSSQHHPFTMPDRTDFDPANEEELLGLNSRAYDLVINGEELGGGSVRIHEMETQEKIFQALRLSRDEVEGKFGFFLRAMEYGVPPHGGIALGLDRVTAMISKASSIREIIAFPKNRSALCPLTRAPSSVDISQLEELGLVADVRAGIPEERISELEEEAPPVLDREKAQTISQKDVRHVAKLARLKLTDQEVHSYEKELSAVLKHFEALQELNTENVRPMSHILELRNIWREDRPGKLRKQDALLTNAPLREFDYFRVPKILEG